MDPGTIGLIVTLITSATSAYMQHEEADAMQDQAEINAKRKKEAAEAAAEQERMTRQAEAREEAREAAQRQARMRAQIAKSGVEFDGTPSLLMEAQAGIDAQNIQQADQDSETRRRNMLAGARMAYSAGRARASAYGRRKRSTLISGTLNTAAAGVKYSEKRGWLDG